MLSVLEPDGVEDLDQEDVADARALANALLKQAFSLLRLRDWWVIAHQPGPEWSATSMSVIFGMESSEHDARRFAERLGFGIYRLAQVHGTGAYERDAAELQVQAEIKFADAPCRRCGHLRTHHGAMKTSRGKWITDMRQAKYSNKCSVNCQCPEFLL